MHPTRVIALGASALLLAGCGGGAGGATADAAVKRWAEAVNDRDWKRACELSIEPGGRCEDALRSSFEGDTLTFEGPATGGDTKPGESYFSLRQGKDGTAFVTAVPRDGAFVVRLEAVVLPPDASA